MGDPRAGAAPLIVHDLVFDPLREQLVGAASFGEGVADTPFTVGSLSTVPPADRDGVGFVLDATNGQSVGIVHVRGPRVDEAVAITVDPTGAVFLGGRYQDAVSFPGAGEVAGPDTGWGGFVYRWVPEPP